MIECEALLVATGRKPNVSNVGLEKAGVEFTTKDGVKVNDQLQTTNKVQHTVWKGTFILLWSVVEHAQLRL